MRKRVFIAGVLPNTANNLIEWIVDPQAHDPHSAMPITEITRSEARDAAAWLYTAVEAQRSLTSSGEWRAGSASM